MKIDLDKINDQEYLKEFIAKNEKGDKKNKKKMKKAEKDTEYVDTVFTGINKAVKELSKEYEKNTNELDSIVVDTLSPDIDEYEVIKDDEISSDDLKSEQSSDDLKDEPVAEDDESTTTICLNNGVTVMNVQKEKVIEDEDTLDLKNNSCRFYLGEYSRLWIHDSVIGNITFTAYPEEEIHTSVDDDQLGELMALTLLNIIVKMTPCIVTTSGRLNSELNGVTKFDINKFIFIKYCIFQDDQDMVLGFKCNENDRESWNTIMDKYMSIFSNEEIANILININKKLSVINFQSMMVGDWVEFKEDASNDDIIGKFFNDFMDDDETSCDIETYKDPTVIDNLYNIATPYECYGPNDIEDVIYDMFDISDEEEGNGGADAEQPFREQDSNECSNDDDRNDEEKSGRAGDESIDNDNVEYEVQEEKEISQEKEEIRDDKQGGDIGIDNAISEAFKEAFKESLQKSE